MHAVVPDVPRVAWIVLFVAINTVVNVMGIETTARMSFIVLVIQLLGLAAFMIAAVLAFANGTAGAHWSTTPFYNPGAISPSLIFGALSLAVTASIFVVLTYTASLFVLGRTSFPSGDATDAAFYDIATLVGGSALKWILAVPGVIFSGLPGALAAQVATTRPLYSMARDGELPRAGPRQRQTGAGPRRTAGFGRLTGARRRTGRPSRAADIDGQLPCIGYVLVNLHTAALIAGVSWAAVGAAVPTYRTLTRSRSRS